ncbi:MAG: protein-L-isoaspartate(D-aspartate) O-methyltransferase [Planctomycetes bacterium]|nr:protein-L-isoaspartate(D-aspartate) O-methyltransferase [Planctomycetota bacterium]
MSSYARQRAHMLDHDLRPRIQDPRVLDAMGQVPRECFVPEDVRERAYGDHPLPIGLDQTISQPFVVAFMAAAASLTGSEKVLEVGAGSGYGAAVLGRLAREVWTVERRAPLAEQARERLRRLNFDNVHVVTADGTLGLPDEAPFDAIVVTAGAAIVPHAFLEQLALGGRLVLPVGRCDDTQRMYRFTQRGSGFSLDELGPFRFVPLVFGADEAPTRRA